ncbi:hypothetical protein N0V93_002384 [Gnomoniopsis smithogilvyi]|uniref:SET domain-containing protein n=1 Tax=Gnomoniopsis smithogilvyi TaxID=1191159 RepID=A0A9W9CYY2_9PEZI|nr:hypothetical protein N0V93_002384 [Gnomoniopsis smithogilvyi]
METDEDPSPLNLEHLLSSPSEDDVSHDVPQYEEASQEWDPTKFVELLAAVPEDDPFMRPMQCKPCLPRLGGEEPFIVKAIPGKGMGVIASRRIAKGSIILNDPFVISLQEPTEDPFPQYETNGLLSQVLFQLLDQYVQLPVDKREQYASLHPHIEPGSREWFQEQLRHAGANLTRHELDLIVRLYYTFNTNEFSKTEPGRGRIWTVRRLFLLTARINHSCCPNARSRQTTDGYKVVTAIRDIEEGEEIALKYLDHSRFSREGWRAITQRTWGFVCDCDGCKFKTEQSE